MKKHLFISSFKKEIYDFLELRTSQGMSLKNLHILISLDQHLAELEITEKVLTPNLIDAWISKYSNALNPNTMRGYISFYTQFAMYLQSLGISAFIPDRPLPDRSYVPYIFTTKEMADLFHAADNLSMKRPTSTSVQFPILLRILYGCGLRLGEALRLRIADFDAANGILTIRSGKGNKDRLVPMDRLLSKILYQYCNTNLQKESDDSFIFASDKGGTRSFAWALQTFQRILREAQIDMLNLPAHSRNICVHCLRHTFAVNAFRQQSLRGVDSYSAVPMLSIYLGHYKLTGTQSYLHMTEENSEDILKLTSKHIKGMFPEVPQ